MSTFQATLSTAQLQALSLLIHTCSISGTGLQLGLTQSAISHVLAGLRRHFGDELLVRQGQAMRPTPFAISLREPVRRVLEQVQDVSALRDGFHPSDLSRPCVIAVRDPILSLLGPALLRRFSAEAPNASLTIIPWDSQRIAGQLGAGRCDLAIAVDPPDTDAGLRIQKLFEDQLVAVSALALAPSALTPETLARRPAMTVSGKDEFDRPVDAALEALGLTRRIAMRSAHILAALSITGETDALLIVPRHFAEKHAAQFNLAVLDLPFALPSFAIFGVGHERFCDGRLYRWLRAVCADAVDEVLPQRTGSAPPTRSPARRLSAHPMGGQPTAKSGHTSAAMKWIQPALNSSHLNRSGP
ncbi:LysR family transcriptional regulator (plasmid) [Brevundimonas staleyi]|uniref:LysR family transcriptional regulator n=1 Tax=Brevundimonas staleyi TaxID=74326 RepID=A0ABW0FNU7_9CAUL